MHLLLPLVVLGQLTVLLVLVIIVLALWFISVENKGLVSTSEIFIDAFFSVEVRQDVCVLLPLFCEAANGTRSQTSSDAAHGVHLNTEIRSVVATTSLSMKFLLC